MITGIFNSIILAGLAKSRAALGLIAGVLPALAQVFNFFADFQKPVAGAPLSVRFNGTFNDTLAFSAERQRRLKAREERISHLMSFLHQLLRLLALGAAGFAEVFAVVRELEALGVRVSGLRADAVLACATKNPGFGVLPLTPAVNF